MKYSYNLLIMMLVWQACDLDKIDGPPPGGNDLPEFQAEFLLESNKTVNVEAVVEAIDSGYVVSGYATSTNFSSNNLFVVKTSKSGAVEKKATNFGVNGDLTGGKLIKVSDGYVLAGTKDGESVFVCKIKPDLTVSWNKTISKAGHKHTGRAIAATSSGDIIVAGTNGIDSGADDPFFAKLSASNGMLVDSQTINITNSGRFFPESICRNGNAFGVLGYNFGLSIPATFFMKIDENLNALIQFVNQPSFGNGSGAIVQGNGEGYMIIDGLSAQLSRQAYVSAIDGNGQNASTFDQFIELPESGFRGGGRTADGKTIAVGWGAQELGVDLFGIAALIDVGLNTIGTYTYAPNSIMAELTAAAPASDDGFLLAGRSKDNTQIVLIKLNEMFKIN